MKSVEHALNTAQPGELMLIQADAIDETMDCVRRYLEKLAMQQQVAEVEEIAANVAAAVPPPAPAVPPPTKVNVLANNPITAKAM